MNLTKLLHAIATGIGVIAVLVLLAGICFWLAGVFPLLIAHAVDIIIFSGVAFLVFSVIIGPLESKMKTSSDS